MKKITYVKEIELIRKEGVSGLLSDMAASKVSLQQVLLTMGNIWIFEGSVALTGLPIVTNDETCGQLINGMICKYVLDNWDLVTKAAAKHWAKTSKKI